MELRLKGRDKEACGDMRPNVLPPSVGLALIHWSCDHQLLARLRPGVLWSICQMVSLIVGTHSIKSRVMWEPSSCATPRSSFSGFCSLLCAWDEPLCIRLMSVFLCLEEDYGQPFQSGCLSCNSAEKLKAKYIQIYIFIYLLLQWVIIRVARDWGQCAVSFP